MRSAFQRKNFLFVIPYTTGKFMSGSVQVCTVCCLKWWHICLRWIPWFVNAATHLRNACATLVFRKKKGKLNSLAKSKDTVIETLQYASDAWNTAQDVNKMKNATMQLVKKVFAKQCFQLNHETRWSRASYWSAVLCSRVPMFRDYF